MAGQDQNNCNQNGIAENNDIELTEPSDESVVEGKPYKLVDFKQDILLYAYFIV